MTNKIDLHTHSTASDGTMTPSELAYYAKGNGLSAIALTDHDTVSGISEFISSCTELGIEGISGVEISAEYKTEMHIVGLFVDYKDEEFIEKLRALSNSRGDRNYKMLELCRQNGFDIQLSDLLDQKDNSEMENVGRPHFANALIKRGYVKDKNEAFEKYLNRGKPCYAKRLAYSPKECIDIIHSAGGIAILAHPIFLSQDRDELYSILSDLKQKGLDGTECYYSEYTKEFSSLCLELCDEIGLLPSGGSDFHADNKPDIPIAVVNGNEFVPYSVLDNMKNQKNGKNI